MTGRGGARARADFAPPLPSRHAFAGRVLSFSAFGFGGIGLSLALGTWGYHAIAGFGWVDATFNAAMILSGMGPAAEMPDAAAKLFASAYAILGGLAWTALLSVILYPFIHRLLHVLHLQQRAGEDE